MAEKFDKNASLKKMEAKVKNFLTINDKKFIPLWEEGGTSALLGIEVITRSLPERKQCKMLFKGEWLYVQCEYIKQKPPLDDSSITYLLGYVSASKIDIEDKETKDIVRNAVYAEIEPLAQSESFFFPYRPLTNYEACKRIRKYDYLSCENNCKIEHSDSFIIKNGMPRYLCAHYGGRLITDDGDFAQKLYRPNGTQIYVKL